MFALASCFAPGSGYYFKKWWIMHEQLSEIRDYPYQISILLFNVQNPYPGPNYPGMDKLSSVELDSFIQTNMKPRAVMLFGHIKSCPVCPGLSA